MNGPQDLGGQHGFGPVAPDPDEPRFHAPWEKRALALTLAAGAMGHWSIDEGRHARESLPPAEYYASPYYAIWAKALEALLIRHGFVTADELRAGHAQAPASAPRRVLRAADVAPAMARGGPVDRDPGPSRATYASGDAVRARVMNPATHTRLPRYVRGRRGRVETVQGFHVFPDANAHGLGERPQWLYAVVFEATELWGADADPSVRVSVDAWESYLERA